MTALNKPLVNASDFSQPVSAPTPVPNTKYYAVLVTPDPFVGASRKAEDYALLQRPTQPNQANVFDSFASDQEVTRPAGISVRPNTYATAQVIDSTGRVRKILNSWQPPTYSADVPTALRQKKQSLPHLSAQSQNAWTDWLLTSVQESRVEKVQIVETFGDTYVYAFGERPRTLQFTGKLVNSIDYPWKAVFWENWENYFRATKLVEQDARMYISFDDVLVEGYPLQAAVHQDANEPNACSFQFSFLVTRYTNLTAKQHFAVPLNFKSSLGRVSTGYGVKQSYDGQILPGAAIEDKSKHILSLMGQGGVNAVSDLAYQALQDAVGDQYAAVLASNITTLLNAAAMTLYNPDVYTAGSAAAATYFSSLGYTLGIDILSTQATYLRQIMFDKGDALMGATPGTTQALLGFAFDMAGRLADRLTTDGKPYVVSNPLAQAGLAALGFGFWPSWSGIHQAPGGMTAYDPKASLTAFRAGQGV